MTTTETYEIQCFSAREHRWETLPEGGGFASEQEAEAAIDNLVATCGWERAELRVMPS